MIAGLPGNAGAYFFVDHDGGGALTLTLWESEEAALASDEAAEKSRASTVAATGIELLAAGLCGTLPCVTAGRSGTPAFSCGRRLVAASGRVASSRWV